jgi:hypothetical protein
MIRLFLMMLLSLVPLFSSAQTTTNQWLCTTCSSEIRGTDPNMDLSIGLFINSTASVCGVAECSVGRLVKICDGAQCYL